MSDNEEMTFRIRTMVLEGRTVKLGLGDDGSWLLWFEKDGQTSQVRISDEAMNALISLHKIHKRPNAIELCVDGNWTVRETQVQKCIEEALE